MSARFSWKLGGKRLPLHVGRADIPSTKEIAHSLSIINRWTGWTRYPYSVAQHAVFTSYLVTPDYALAALRHDDHECVVGDISAPLKRELASEVLEDICTRFDCNVSALYGLSYEAAQQIKRADLLAAYLEARYLVCVSISEADSHFGHMVLTEGECERMRTVANRIGSHIPWDGIAYLMRELDWRSAKQMYIERYVELVKELT